MSIPSTVGIFSGVNFCWLMNYFMKYRIRKESDFISVIGYSVLKNLFVWLAILFLYIFIDFREVIFHVFNIKMAVILIC